MIPTSGLLLGLAGIVLLALVIITDRVRAARSEENGGSNKSSKWQILAVLVGTSTISIGVTARVAPEQLTAILDSIPVSIPQNTSTLIATGASMVGLGVLAGLFRARAESTTRHTLESGGIETIQFETEEQEVLGKGDLQRYIARLRSGDATRKGQESADRHIRQEIRDQSMTVLQSRGYSDEEASRAISTGTWTEQRDVAAFLGGSEAPSMPLAVRLQDWLSTDPATVRRAERTIAELERIAGGGGYGEIRGKEDA